MSAPDTDTRDRVIRMEAELKALKEDVEQMGKKVDVIHTMLTEANGVRKFVSAMIMLSKLGGIAALFAVFNWLAGKFGLH